MTTALPPIVPALSAEPARRVHLLRRLLKNPTGVVALAFVTLVALVAIFGKVIAPHNPNLASLNLILAKPSAEHLLGGDSAGRDVLSRLLAATQISMAAALLALVISVALGVSGGLLAGYYKGWTDNTFSWLTSLIMAMPSIVILLAARAVLGPSVWISMAIFGVVLAPAFFRLVYAAVSAVREELYVDAARVSGLSDTRIISRHILSVVRAPIIIQSAMILGIAIAIQSGLEFLGLGDPSVPTWGAMLNDGFQNIFRAPDLMLWPSLAIGLTCIALTLLANAMRDELERASGGKKRRRGKRGAAVEDVTPPEEVIAHEDDARAASRTGEELIRLTDVRVGYDQPDGSVIEVVHSVSLTIRRGEVHGLVGESGSGKTQTAFAVLGLLPVGGRVLGGSIQFEGAELAGANERTYAKVRGLKIAYIPQEPMSNLDPSFTIGSQLMEPLRVNLGMDKAAAKAKALALLARVGIPNPERTFAAYPHEISGGMAQRVLIAGAVSTDPDLLIADEPTTALDVTVQAEVLEVLRDLQAERQMGVLLVTHNFGVVADLCDRVSVMKSGLIVETGPVRALFNSPKHPYTQTLLESILEDGPARKSLSTKEA
ncbi:dipeptide/oligopeptide/nickel ABC transporter permease/ATP-binding protein [Pengzhenrongella sp.]|jgi:ABC-type dipeptide/oligopeptide/nickel transport system ATPase component/ABC-type dipeptide/oligopeptide/nickel transport system permease subunit|uniref:dipeptide/oligopeptide/nickel ABC transporter permease/ATP-binding protein n=1 Tax=Pengzhenrongella sp. TaxID=2888820 RepID=UPI002F93881D